jgi:NAD(P)-dependent dehydrogenase (short-subunit alcohol dehydrogenase family)
MKGWPKFAYGVSKIGVTVMTQIQQREMDRTGVDDIIVNAVSVISVVVIDL